MFNRCLRALIKKNISDSAGAMMAFSGWIPPTTGVVAAHVAITATARMVL
jgi:hypothetical protein